MTSLLKSKSRDFFAFPGHVADLCFYSSQTTRRLGMVNTTTPASSSNIWVATSDGDFDRVKVGITCVKLDMTPVHG